MRRHLWIAVILCASTWVLAQQPQVTNTQFQSESANSGVSATVDRFLRTNQSLWVGYQVPVLAGTHLSSCSSWKDSSHVEDGCCGEYLLEQGDDNQRTSDRGHAETSAAYVLFRLERGSVKKVRSVMAGCRLNAGGVPFVWLTGVNPDESVDYIAKLISEEASTKEARHLDHAFAILSLHGTPKATDVLSKMAAPNKSFALREKAAFWLGAQRGHDGFTVLQRLLRNEQDGKFREKLVFDLFVNSDPAVVDELIQLAKSDSDAGVRGQAIFWLAQKAGKKATAALSDAVDNDPEIAVKKKAVFAISQLPKDESITQLVHIAETNPSPAIRREAIFWLGQTKDTRAVAYLEQILKR